MVPAILSIATGLTIILVCWNHACVHQGQQNPAHGDADGGGGFSHAWSDNL